MWNLVKTEIRYFKWLFIISIALTFLINIGLTTDGRWIEAQNDFPGLRVIWLGIGIVVLFFTLLFNRKSGRLRTKTLLPITILKLSLSRWISFLIFWLILIFILVFFYILHFNDSINIGWFINLITITGIIVFLNSIPMLYSDFTSSILKNWEKTTIALLWSAFFIIYIVLNLIFSIYFDFIAPEIFSASRSSLTQLYFTKTYTFVSLCMGIIMFICTIWSFNKRKLYLE